MVSNFKTNLITVFAFYGQLGQSQPMAYGQQGLDWIVGPGYSLGSSQCLVSRLRGGQGGREEKEVVIRIFFFRLYFFASMVLAALHIYRRSGLMHDVAI